MNIQIYGKPNIKLINFIKNNREKYIFILYTCRKDKELQEALSYVQNIFGIAFDYVNENVPELVKQFGDSRKIYADYYIDDKAYNVNTVTEMLNILEGGK